MVFHFHSGKKEPNQTHLDRTVSFLLIFLSEELIVFRLVSCAFSRWADCIQETQAPFNIHHSHKHLNKPNEKDEVKKKTPHSLHHWITHNVHVYFWGQKQKHKKIILSTYHLSSNKEFRWSSEADKRKYKEKKYDSNCTFFFLLRGFKPNSTKFDVIISYKAFWIFRFVCRRCCCSFLCLQCQFGI